MKNFVHRFRDLAEKRSALAIGIDPSRELLKAWKLKETPEGVRDFGSRVLEAVGDSVTLIKPQIAFFERFGPAGLEVLVELLQKIRKQDVLSLVDAKRGDIGTTSEAYAEAYFGSKSPFYADAITVSPYLGFESLQPIYQKAVTWGSGVFVVVLSSNHDGRLVQTARLSDGRTVWEYLADSITQFNKSLGAEIGPIGAVVGATVDEHVRRVVGHLPRSLILAPGIGAQGGTFEGLSGGFHEARDRVIPTLSREILSKGPSVQKLREAILAHREKAFELLPIDQGYMTADI